jgi:multicomponent Na+:H+ antiporter subunit F
MMESGISQFLILGSFSILLAALVLALIRLIRGPEPSNMVLALDLIASIIMGYILLYSVLADKIIYFDIAIVISLISFMGTVAISIYLKEKR